VRARFSAPAQTGPGAHTASFAMGKWPRRGVDPPPPPTAEVKE